MPGFFSHHIDAVREVPMPAVTRMDHTIALTVLVLALLLASVPSTALEDEEEGVTFIYIGVAERLERGLGPAPSGGPVTVMFDGGGDRMLVVGYEHANDLRVLDRDLALLGVLEPPFEGFNVSGATISERGTQVLAWGRTPSNATDVLVAFSLVGFQPDLDLIPEGTVKLDRITAAHVLADGLILAVGGSDAMGTTRMAFVETLQAAELRNDSYPGAGSVVSLRDDGHDLLALLDDGTALVYATTNWTLEMTLRPFDGPVTASEVRPGNYWCFGSSEGRVVEYKHEMERFDVNLSLPETPVEGLYSSGPGRFLVVAAQGEGAGSDLSVCKHGDKGWHVQSTTLLEGEVTALVGDPGANATFAACMADGSVDFYSVVLEKEQLPQRPESWGDLWGSTVALTILVAIVVLAAVYLWNRRRTRE